MNVRAGTELDLDLATGGPLMAGGRRRIKKVRRSRLFTGTPERLALLERIILTYDTLYLDEIRDLFAEAAGVFTSVSTVARAIRQLNFTRKKVRSASIRVAKGLRISPFHASASHGRPCT